MESVRFVKSKPSQMNSDLLDAFFSGEYEQDVSLIKQFIGQYSSYTDELLSRIKTLRTSLGSYPAAGIEASKIDPIIELLNGYFSKNKAEMLIKEKEPGRIISLTETAATTSSMKQLVINGNAAVTKHNEMVDNYTSEKDTLVADIWVFLMDENEALIAGYLNDIETFTKAKKKTKKESTYASNSWMTWTAKLWKPERT